VKALPSLLRIYEKPLLHYDIERSSLSYHERENAVQEIRAQVAKILESEQGRTEAAQLVGNLSPYTIGGAYMRIMRSPYDEKRELSPNYILIAAPWQITLKVSTTPGATLASSNNFVRMLHNLLHQNLRSWSLTLPGQSDTLLELIGNAENRENFFALVSYKYYLAVRYGRHGNLQRSTWRATTSPFSGGLAGSFAGRI